MSNFRRLKIEREDYLTNVIKYIHFNPVKHGVVRNISEWKFSSYNVLCSEGETFLAREKTIRWFGRASEFKEHHEKLAGKLPREIPEN